jgi:hypothetical protein
LRRTYGALAAVSRLSAILGESGDFPVLRIVLDPSVQSEARRLQRAAGQSTATSLRRYVSTYAPRSVTVE